MRTFLREVLYPAQPRVLMLSHLPLPPGGFVGFFFSSSARNRTQDLAQQARQVLYHLATEPVFYFFFF